MRINIRDFKNANFSGIADDGYIINKAIELLKNPIVPTQQPGGIIYLPAGRYFLDTSIILDGEAIQIEGDGCGYHDSNGTCLVINSNIDGIIVRPAYTNPNTYGIYEIANTHHAIIRNLQITSKTHNALFGGNSKNGIAVFETPLVSIENVVITYMGENGIYITDDRFDIDPFYAPIKDNSGTYKTNAVFNSQDWRINNCKINNCGMHGLFINDFYHKTSAGCAHNLFCIANAHYGVVDQCVNGNTYVACHFEQNGMYDPATDTTNYLTYYPAGLQLSPAEDKELYYYDRQTKIYYENYKAKYPPVQVRQYPIGGIRKGGGILIDSHTAYSTFIGCYNEPYTEEPYCIGHGTPVIDFTTVDQGKPTDPIASSPVMLPGFSVTNGSSNIVVVGNYFSNYSRQSLTERIGTGNSKLRFMEFDRSEAIHLRNIQVQIPHVEEGSNLFSALRLKYTPQDVSAYVPDTNRLEWNLQRIVDVTPTTPTVRDANYIASPNSFDRTWVIKQYGSPVIPFGWTDATHFSGDGYFFFGNHAIANQQSYFTCKFDITNLLRAEMIIPEASFPLTCIFTSPDAIPWLLQVTNPDPSVNKNQHISGQFSVTVEKENYSTTPAGDLESAFQKVRHIHTGTYMIDDTNGFFSIGITLLEKFDFPNNVRLFLNAHFEKWIKWSPADF